MKKHILKKLAISATLMATTVACMPVVNVTDQSQNQLLNQVMQSNANHNPGYYNLSVNYKYKGPQSCYTTGTNVGGPVSGLEGSQTISRTIRPVFHYGDLGTLAQHVISQAFHYPELSGLTQIKYANKKLTFKAPVEFLYQCRKRKPMYPDNGDHSTFGGRPRLKPTMEGKTSNWTSNSFYWDETETVILKNTDVEILFTHDIWDFGIDVSKFLCIRNNLIQINENHTYRGFKSVILAVEINNEFLKNLMQLALVKINSQELLNDPRNVDIKETAGFKLILEKMTNGELINIKHSLTRYFVKDLYLSRKQYDVNYWINELRNNKSLDSLTEIKTEYADFKNKYEINFDSHENAKNLMEIFMNNKIVISLQWGSTHETTTTTTEHTLNYSSDLKTFRFGIANNPSYSKMKISYEKTPENVRLKNIRFGYQEIPTDKKFEMPINLLIGEASHNFNNENYYICNPQFDIRNLFKFKENLTIGNWTNFLSYNNLDTEIKLDDFLEKPTMWLDKTNIIKQLFVFDGENILVNIDDDALKTWLLEASDTLYLNANFAKLISKFSVAAADLGNYVTINLAYRDINENGELVSNKLLNANFNIYLTPDYRPITTNTEVTNQRLNVAVIPNVLDIKKHILENFIAYVNPQENTFIYTMHNADDWQKEVLDEIIILEHSDKMINGIIKYKKWISFNGISEPEYQTLEIVDFSLILNSTITEDKDKPESTVLENQAHPPWLSVIIASSAIMLISIIWIVYVIYKKKQTKNKDLPEDMKKDTSTIELF